MPRDSSHTIVSLRRSPVCRQDCQALPLESAVGTALGDMGDTRPCVCAVEPELERGLRVGAFFSS